MKVQTIEDIRKLINKNILTSFLTIFSLSIIVIFFTHKKLQSKASLLNQQQVLNAINVYRLNLSEKLSIIASSTIFIDFIRSGPETRSQLLPQILYQFKTFHSTSISGMSIQSDTQGEIFLNGVKTNQAVTLNLCYLDGALDNKMGVCHYTWTLYFNPQSVITEIKSINHDIIDCNHCHKMDIFSGPFFGSFPIATMTPLAIGLTMREGHDYSFYVYNVLIIIMLISFAAWNRYRVNGVFNKYIADPLETITSQLKRGDKIDHFDEEVQELTYLIDQIENWKQQLHNAKSREKEAEIGSLVNQILHDIRSPLTAINAMVDYLPELGEKKRVMLKHATDTLNDIVNGILDVVRKGNNYLQTADSPEPIAMLLERIVSEKRSQWMNAKIAITLNIQDEARGLFANLDHVQFKRTIANLINNAAEATQDNPHRNRLVRIHLSHTDRDIQIGIEDNGCGISPEKLPCVLQGGVTTKKEGMGLGLLTAKNSIESWGGCFSIHSKVGQGTTITLTIPQTHAADWFANKIKIYQDSTIVILDDDKSIHYIWDEKFKNEISPIDNIQWKHFYDPTELIQYRLTFPNENIHFLIDHELIHSNQSGLDIIEQLNISNSSILVTSRYENLIVREKSKKLSVKIIPKNYAPYTPIQIVCNNPDIVFLDDVESITYVWKTEGERKKKRVAIFNDIDSFRDYIRQCKRETKIYIDSDLNSSIQGEDLAKELFERGYENLYLATGHGVKDIFQLPYIKAIVGKDPPF